MVRIGFCVEIFFMRANMFTNTQKCKQIFANQVKGTDAKIMPMRPQNGWLDNVKIMAIARLKMDKTVAFI